MQVDAGDLAVRTMASQGYSIALYRDALSQSILLGQLANAYSASNKEPSWSC